MSAIRIDAGPELETMIRIAREASVCVGELYREHCASGIEVQMKRPNDPVTAADKQANTIICSALAVEFPDAAVVAEESVPEGRALAEALRSSRVFFVDPLDGTREFVDRNPEFAVMIGLAVDGQARAGVVATPTDGRIIAGRVGQRCLVEETNGERALFSVHPRTSFADAKMVISRSHRPAIVDPLARRLGIREMIPCGSVGVKVLRLVEQVADVYVHAGGGLKKWDTCAPEAILAAAGGRMTDLDGEIIDYQSGEIRVRNGLVATNGALHPGVLSAVGWAAREVERIRQKS